MRAPRTRGRHPSYADPSCAPVRRAETVSVRWPSPLVERRIRAAEREKLVMTTRSGRERGAKAAKSPETPEPTAGGGLPREENAEPDWDRPETLRHRSGLSVVVWFLLPLIAILLWGYFTR